LDVKEIYRALALTAAHFHLMIRNKSDPAAIPPPRFYCPMDHPLNQDNVRV